MEAIVFGNITLDVLCYPVEDVPRNESTAFEKGIVSPGGSGSNTAIGLCALEVLTALVGRIGNDEAAWLVKSTWDQTGLDQRYIKRDPDQHTAISVGLVDRSAQPRFIHTPGANANLTIDDLDLTALKTMGAKMNRFKFSNKAAGSRPRGYGHIPHH